MWECYNCGFQNVDAAPVCAKCRARKPAPGEEPKGRSYYAMQEAARSRAADEMMTSRFSTPPTAAELKNKWLALTDNPQLTDEMIDIEQRQYSMREAIRHLLTLARNPQARAADEIVQTILTTLMNWDLRAEIVDNDEE